MIREEILKEYDVDENGRIRSPGKFEGEMLYVPHFWHIGLEGFANYDDGKVFTFRLGKTEREIFPELGKGRQWLKLVENDQGFVSEI